MKLSLILTLLTVIHSKNTAFFYPVRFNLQEVKRFLRQIFSINKFPQDVNYIGVIQTLQRF